MPKQPGPNSTSIMITYTDVEVVCDALRAAEDGASDPEEALEYELAKTSIQLQVCGEDSEGERE